MPKKTNVELPEVKKWLAKCQYAEKKRNDADTRFGYSRSLKEYAGDYESTLPSFLMNTPVVPINEVFGFTKTFIPSVYSRDPHITFTPTGARGVGPCKLLELTVNAYWRELRLKRQVRRAIFDAIFAEGWMKTGFSSSFGSIEAKDGETPLESNEFIENKEIFSTRISWRNMVRDPDAVDGIHDARFVAQKIIKPLQAVLDSDLYTAKNIRATHKFDPASEIDKPGRRTFGDQSEDFIEFWEIWDMDSARVYWVSEGCDEYMRDPQKWPYRFDGYPFDLLRFTQLEDEAYAPNLIGPWEPQLWEKIKIRSMQMDHIKRFNRQLWAEEGSVSKTEVEKFARGQTGAINFYKGKAPPIPAQYPQIQTDIYAIENRIDLDKDNISGQPNAVRSAPQKTQTRTLGEVNTMISAFQNRQQDPQSDVEDFCSEVAIKIACIAQDYLTGEQMVRVTQEDLPALIKAFGKDRFDGTSFKYTRKDMEDAEFEAIVRAGSTLPLDRQGRMEAMVNVLKLGQNIGLTPGDYVSKVIGKNMMTEMELKEIELAYERIIAEMEQQKALMQEQARMQNQALQDNIERARQRVLASREAGPGQAQVPGVQR